MNVIARLEYELAYYDSAVHRCNHYTTRTPHFILREVTLTLRPNVVNIPSEIEPKIPTFRQTSNLPSSAYPSLHYKHADTRLVGEPLTGHLSTEARIGIFPVPATSLQAEGEQKTRKKSERYLLSPLLGQPPSKPGPHLRIYFFLYLRPISL